jgi:Rad3-related DNA helicase
VWVFKQADENKFREELDKMMEIGHKFNLKNSNFSSRARLAFFSVKSIVSDKNFILLQQPTGTGKTWSICMVADYVQKYLGKNVVYCTLNLALHK